MSTYEEHEQELRQRKHLLQFAKDSILFEN